MLRLTQNARPSCQQGGSVVDCLVYGAHVGFGLFERGRDAFDHFVDFAHTLELGLEAGVSSFLGVMAVF